MGWYEAIKDGISIAQQADNIPLVQNLIEAQKQILDLIAENNSLKEENEKLNRKLNQHAEVVRSSDTYITFANDPQKIIYCATCWDNNKKAIQVSCDDIGRYKCTICKNNGFYDKDLYDKNQKDLKDLYDKNQKEVFDAIESMYDINY